MVEQITLQIRQNTPLKVTTFHLNRLQKLGQNL